MRIKSLYLKDFRGYPEARFEFGEFTCLIGPNGIGKTTVLDAVSLLCSSLDFSIDMKTVPDFNGTVKVANISPEARMRAFLKKNIRNVDEADACKGFVCEGLFEHDGEDLRVRVEESGPVVNEMVGKPVWWAGISYFAKFDVDMNNFVLPRELWDDFSSAYEGITGIKVEPDFYDDIDERTRKSNGTYATGFFLHKNGSRVHSRKASAGEKKIAKSLSQIINLPSHRLPHIVLVDNMEMHIHHKRHLRAFEEIKKIFSGMQIIATTHSTVVIDQYQPREHLVDVETAIVR